jgi:hypothetical protein
VIKTVEERQAGKGTGNWACWEPSEINQLLEAAASWAKQVPPGKKYWLCWNLHPAWCRLQQRLVREVGWTPIVGTDQSGTVPPVLDGSICIDFNAAFKLPCLWSHVPLELVFSWVDRLAFWHGDVLLPPVLMRRYARRFEALDGPVTAAVYCRRNLWQPRGWNNAPRYWEVLGCTTRAASLEQSHCGGGWWRHFQNHPNCREVARLHDYHWDHGGGIRYWEREHGGQVQRIALPCRYHFSTTAQTRLPRNVSKADALGRLDLGAITGALGIQKWVEV